MAVMSDRTTHSDRTIATMRRLMLEATHVLKAGTVPEDDPAAHRNARAHEASIPAAADWRERFASELETKW